MSTLKKILNVILGILYVTAVVLFYTIKNVITCVVMALVTAFKKTKVDVTNKLTNSNYTFKAAEAEPAGTSPMQAS